MAASPGKLPRNPPLLPQFRNASIDPSSVAPIPECFHISRISVSEICKRAEIHRTTFYVHYKDVTDLMEHLVTEMYRQMVGLFVEEGKGMRPPRQPEISVSVLLSLFYPFCPLRKIRNPMDTITNPISLAGGYKTIACIENTNAWDGACPFVIGSPYSLPNTITLHLEYSPVSSAFSPGRWTLTTRLLNCSLSRRGRGQRGYV